MTEKLKHTFEKLFNELKGNGRKIYSSPLYGSAKSFFIRELFADKKKVYLLCPDKQSLIDAKIELNILGLGEKIVSVEDYELEILQENITDLSNREEFILLSDYRLITIPLPEKESLKKSTTLIELGGDVSYDEMIEYLNILGYREEKYVDVQGDYSVRGSIIDFWSYSEKQPARLEYDGDFLETIRYFDAENQRSISKIDSVSLAAPLSVSEETSYASVFDYFDDAVIIASENELRGLFQPEEKNQPAELEDELEEELKEEIAPQTSDELTESEKKDDFITEEKLFSFKHTWIIEEEITFRESKIETGLLPAPILRSSLELLCQTVSKYIENGFRVVITSENEIQAQRLSDLLSEFKEKLKDFILSGKLKINVLPVKEGFVAEKDKLLFLTDYQIFNKPYRSKIASKRKAKKSNIKEFSSIKRGDYVVHEYFGIGKYAGLETIKIGQAEQESIKILYAEGGIVYVNLNYLSLVKKFSSKENIAPKLTKLGSGEWKKTKKKVKKKIKEAARELITLYAKRKASQGIRYNPDTIWQRELEASFFYEDTPDQMKVTEEVKNDMESETPMDRLVCGDVGFGKTEIAVRAAFKAVSDGMQTALLVPTTILAEQHFNTFKDRLSQYPVKVAVLSRFVTPAKQKNVIEELEKGTVDILIGTHRLLSKDIKFKKLGLLIIDEEHRFGVMAKEKLRSLRVNVDTLTLTATPIPRTLNLSLLGARDLSIIATPPPNRRPIITRVELFDIHKVREWILAEIKRSGQVYLVHDRVHSIEKLASYIKKYIPEISIGIAHGQLKPAQLETVIHNFLNKKFDVLLSTKIIESGIDIPNVNTIIVNRADRFGLAELHQLRGRVGRSNKQAYAFFLVPSMNTITKKALKRLQAIEEYTGLGEGFNLSMRDLEIRGSGNLLGTEQSGAIDTVGFELYLKLLDEAVSELKAEEFADVFKELPKHLDRTEPTIDAYFEIGIPKHFMPDQADRLSYYTALFSVANENEIDDVREEMIDKFGKIPDTVENLIYSAKLRFFASFAMFEKIIIKENITSLYFPKPEREDYYVNHFAKVMQWVTAEYSKTVRFYQKNKIIKLEIKNKFPIIKQNLQFLIEFCKNAAETINNLIDDRGASKNDEK
ncbi:MAG: transcription-repair coupling factor [Chlorobi bacterium]|nr:transcription-repair coupling factor [Chlorobiota bacterium]